jgi:multidrug resistance efflux pump
VNSSHLIIEAAEVNDTLVVALGKPSRALRSTYYTIVAVLLAALVWAYFSVVDISVHAQGVVRPTSGVHPVQSTITAVIRELRVQENSRVEKGDTLAILDVPASEERMHLHKERTSRLQQELADIRALAELSAAHRFTFPVYARERDVALSEKALREKELAAAEARLKRTSDLFAKTFASREEYENARLQAEQKAQALEQWRQSHRRSALDREKQVVTSLLEQESALKELTLSHRNTVLCAPQSGIVTNLSVRAANVVLTPSQNLCTIAPEEEQCVEFTIPARDVGFVREGLKVRYQIEALPFQEWGTAQGNVQLVGKDLLLSGDTKQQAGFKVVGTIGNRSLESKRQGQQAAITLGMTCRASIVVAQKRMITMLWDKGVKYLAL